MKPRESPAKKDFSKHLRVGIMGYYEYGNFGDDLMAVLFGLVLKQLQVEVVIYGLCPAYASVGGFTVVDTVDALVDQSDILVYGGGGFLLPVDYTRRRFIRPGQAGHIAKHAQTLQRLADRLRATDIPLLILSVGGDGSYSEKNGAVFKRELIQRASFVSVRNPEDLATIERLGIPGAAYTDVVWQFATFFPSRRRNNRRLRIGVDIYNYGLIKRKAFYLPVLLFCLPLVHPDKDFVFIDTTNAGIAPFRALRPPWKRPNTSSYQFHDPAEDFRLINSLDLVISSRLHLGVAGLSCNIPFLSVAGGGKTRLFMKNSGLSHFFYSHRRMIEFIRLAGSRKKLTQLITGFQLPNREALIRQSARHFAPLQRIVAEYSQQHQETEQGK